REVCAWIDQWTIAASESRHWIIFERETVGVRKTVPAPVAQNADRHRLGIVIGKGLQAGDVEVKGEPAVAYGHCAVGVGGANGDIVARDESVAIDWLVGAGMSQQACADCEKDQQFQTTHADHFSSGMTEESFERYWTSGVIRTSITSGVDRRSESTT